MSEVRVRITQALGEWAEGELVTLKRTAQVDTLIADGRAVVLVDEQPVPKGTAKPRRSKAVKPTAKVAPPSEYSDTSHLGTNLEFGEPIPGAGSD